MIKKVNNNLDHNHYCIFCDKFGPEVQVTKEHIIPDSIGGFLFIDQFVCSDCNSRMGAYIDSEIWKLPEILQALEELNIEHENERIVNRHYSISADTGDIVLKHGRIRNGKVEFPIQTLDDGSTIAPDEKIHEYLTKIVTRDKKLIAIGLTKEEINSKLKQLQIQYKRAKRGSFVGCPELGINLLKRKDDPKVSFQLKKKANIEPLIAKIAYEILFFYGYSKFLSDENVEIREQLITTIDERKVHKDCFISRENTGIIKYHPIHFIRLELLKSATIIRVRLFGRLQYMLHTKQLSKDYYEQLKKTFEIDDLYAITYQQDLNKREFSFWIEGFDDDPRCFGAWKY